MLYRYFQPFETVAETHPLCTVCIHEGDMMPRSTSTPNQHDTRVRRLAAYLNRWRRNLDPPPRPLLRPKLFLLLDIRRRNTIHKFLTAWGLLTRHLVTNRLTARRQGIRILRLLRGREVRLTAAGMERWKDTARAERALDRLKATSLERWKLFVLLCRVSVRMWEWSQEGGRSRKKSHLQSRWDPRRSIQICTVVANLFPHNPLWYRRPLHQHR